MKLNLMAAAVTLVVLTTLSSCLVAVRPAYGGDGYRHRYRQRGPRHHHHYPPPRPPYRNHHRGW